MVMGEHDEFSARTNVSFPAEDSEEEDQATGEEEDEFPEEFANGDKNSQLAVGFKGDRSYVVRGNNIGVFRHSPDEEQVKYYATIANIANPKGKKFKPKKVWQSTISDCTHSNPVTKRPCYMIRTTG